jgi:ribosomal protein S12 methylthiotransferase
MPDDGIRSGQTVVLLPAAATVYLLSLGCVKNLVDSECMSKIIQDAGYSMVQEPCEADILIVNTCAFIESAKREAIDAILDLAAYKKPQGRANFLIVAGCLPQRYAKEIRQDLPEVDAVLGTADYARIAGLMNRLMARDDPASLPMPGIAGSLEHLSAARELSYPGCYVYIKIAEGCDNHCAYCAIPGIRGPYRSRAIEDIVAEVRRFSQSGRDEIILIAQDTTLYGLDFYGRPMLADLLGQICQIDSVRLVRIMYAYAACISDELIEIMASQPKIAHYLDMPIQHASDRMLIRMNRKDTQERILQAVEKLRRAMPDIILRSTILVGFPGETNEDFTQLVTFLKQIRIDRLGCFIFSPEEGTAAFSMRPRTKASVARKRWQEIMLLAREITCSANRSRIGMVYPVTLESIDDRGIFFIGRSYGEAPEVDPVIYVAGTAADLCVGQTLPVRLVEAGDYDMTGVTRL